MASQFSKLSWNDDDQCWSGKVRFAGQQLETMIDFDIDSPTETQRNAAVDRATSLLVRLTQEWELESRREAATEITQATYSQSESAASSSDVDELLADMTLEALEFSYRPNDDEIVGILGYRAENCFPEMNLQINFLEDLSIDEVMVTD